MNRLSSYEKQIGAHKVCMTRAPDYSCQIVVVVSLSGLSLT